MDDLFQQAKFCAQNFKQCLEDNADVIGSLDSLVALLGVLVSVVGGVVFWRWKRQGTDPAGNSFDGGSGGTTVHGPFVQTGSGSTVEFHSHHPVDLAVIEDLLKDKASLQSERDSWKEQFEKALEDLPAAGAEEGRSEAEIRRAQAASAIGDTALAEAIYRERLQRLEKQVAVKQLAETHRNLGALAFLHDTQSALDHYRKSTVLDADDPDGWNQLGLLLQRIGELLEAKNAYQQVLRLASSADDGRALKAVAYGNLWSVHETRGELDHAVEMFEKALALNMELGSKQGMASNYANLGSVHQIRGELDQVVQMYEKALTLNTELGSKQGMAIDYNNLGIVHRMRGELDQARKVWAIALGLFEELDSPEVAKVRQWLSELEST